MPKLDLDAIPQTNATGYPAPFNAPVSGRRYRRLAPACGLEHLRASHVVLEPGAWSSQRHWHTDLDELLVMLAGEAVLVEDDGETAVCPGDILASRKGLSVEVNNTDAEGRLVLADALALGAEEEPDLMISMATLTGAARVAVGPDLAPFYTDADDDAAAIARAAARVADPVWRMPFHAPYESMIEPGIADLDNAPSGGMAGSITAALFLRRFAEPVRYAHFDIYGWNPKPAPARPKGGVGMGARALFEAMPELLGLG